MGQEGSLAGHESDEPWLTRGVVGIGTASFLADIGHEIPTALLPALLASTLGAPASSLGLIEGLSDGLAGATRFTGGALTHVPAHRLRLAVGGYSSAAVLASLTGAATSAWQVGVLRAGASTARGLRVPARNALLADTVSPSAYGRAYGFERMMGSFGAVIGPLLALGLVVAVGTRTAIELSVIPGVLAAAAIIYVIRQTPAHTHRDKVSLRFQVRPLLHGQLGRLLGAIALFEAGNAAATLFILRTSTELAPEHGRQAATQIALGLYVAFNAAAAVASPPAGRISDRLGARGPVAVLLVGFVLIAISYIAWGVPTTSIAAMAVPFVLAGIAIGCVETAEHAAVAGLAPVSLRSSAFGMLATIQAIGNLLASAVAGLIWTLVSPEAAFIYLAISMVLAAIALGTVTFRTEVAAYPGAID